MWPVTAWPSNHLPLYACIERASCGWRGNDQGPRTVIRGNSRLNHSPGTLMLWEWHGRKETSQKAPSEGAFH